MKILVCISKTPETTAKISFTNNGTAFDPAGVQYMLNPYDEWYALVKAIELQEQHSGTVTVINVGDQDNDAIIRKALAIGADDAIRVDKQPLSAMDTAFQIATVARQEQYDLILMGKETIDYNGAEVGSMVAEYLNLPFISFGSDLQMKDNKAQITREIEGGVEISEVALPLVISAAKGMAEQRIPNMKGIMMAKKKPLKVVAPQPFEDVVQTVRFELPQTKSAVKMIEPDNMNELVRLLHEEAKVI